MAQLVSLRLSTDAWSQKWPDYGRSYCLGVCSKSILVDCRDSTLLGSKRGRCSQEVDLAPRKACVWHEAPSLPACSVRDLNSRRFVASSYKRGRSGCHQQFSQAGMSGQIAPAVGMERSLSGNHCSRLLLVSFNSNA